MDCTFTLRDNSGGEHRLDMGRRRVMAVDRFHRLVPKVLREDLQGGSLTGIEIDIAEADSKAMLQLYALTFYEYRSKRNYRRPAQLPFPTHPDGVVPTAKTSGEVRVRQEAGVNQEELASRAGTLRPTLLAYEHGRKSPTLVTVERLLDSAGFELTAEPRSPSARSRCAAADRSSSPIACGVSRSRTRSRR